MRQMETRLVSDWSELWQTMSVAQVEMLETKGCQVGKGCQGFTYIYIYTYNVFVYVYMYVYILFIYYTIYTYIYTAIQVLYSFLDGTAFTTADCWRWISR